MFFIRVYDEDPEYLMININSHIRMNGSITLCDIFNLVEVRSFVEPFSLHLDYGYTKPFKESDVVIKETYNYDLMKREVLIEFPDPKPLEGEEHGKIL